MRRTRQRRQSSSHVLKREDHRVTERGQAAMEFLMSYGWALLVTLVVVGALAYLGILEPARFVPNKCNIAPGIACPTFKADLSGNAFQGVLLAGDEHIRIQLQHSLGRPITNVKLTLSAVTVGGSDTYSDGSPICPTGPFSDNSYPISDTSTTEITSWQDGVLVNFAYACGPFDGLPLTAPWAVGKKMRAQLILDYTMDGVSRTKTGEIVADVEA